jgi:carbamoyl-phosphate synthase large subunit
MSVPGTTVVLTGIGLDGGPDIIRALRADAALAARVVGLDIKAATASAYLCDSFHVVPRRDDPSYVSTVAEIARSEGARVIYPLPSFDQEIFAAARPDLERDGFSVAVSPDEAVRVCNDKWLLYQRMRATFPEAVPERRRVADSDELVAAAMELGYPGRRVCVRRRVSRGAIGFRVIDDGPSRVGALLDQNPNSTLISLNELLDVLRHADPFPTDYLVEEYLPGDEWDVDVLCRHGEPIIVATRHNLAMRGGGATHSILTRSAVIESLSERIVADLELNAIVNLSFRHDEAGTAKLIEINPRIPSSVLCALGGGVNLVALAVRQALGEAVARTKPAWGGQFLLHCQSVVIDGDGRPAIA